MNEARENIIVNKSYSFALEIVKLYKALVKQNEFVLSKQILRSGTSVGANIHEAVAGQSKKDFVYKLGLALKEARETSYWLNLLKDSEFISIDIFIQINEKCEELMRILNSIILTTKEKYLSEIHNS